MLRGNIGEWSEVYAWLKILADGKIQPGDAWLNPIIGREISVLTVERTDNGVLVRYNINSPNVEVELGKHQVKLVSQFKFKSVCESIIRAISDNRGGTFEVPAANAFLSTIGCTTLTASSRSKADFFAHIRDPETSDIPKVGYSVKSQLGGASTLLNAGKTTNFVFFVKGGITEADVDSLNAMAGNGHLKARVDALYRMGYSLEFESMANDVFQENLVLSDSLMPEIIASFILQYYRGMGVKIEELLDAVINSDFKIHASDKVAYLQRKIKQLLSDIALGMVPSLPWSGSYNATGAFALVKSDGEVVTYHLYNRDQFENYLFSNTRLETASTSRHGFGYFYQEKGFIKINLNLQIRFSN